MNRKRVPIEVSDDESLWFVEDDKNKQPSSSSTTLSHTRKKSMESLDAAEIPSVPPKRLVFWIFFSSS
jgi:hypothetical protein